MLNTHSMMQNILKYRTVIIDLRNTHLPYTRNLHFACFLWQGVLLSLERKKNCQRGCVFCLHILSHETCWSFCFHFTLSRDEKENKKNQGFCGAICTLRQKITCLHVNLYTFNQQNRKQTDVISHFVIKYIITCYLEKKIEPKSPQQTF